MSEEFCSGVKVLLERMDTNPEEFVYGAIDTYGDDLSQSRWYDYLPTRSPSEVEDETYGLNIPEMYLTEGEKLALKTKLASLYRDRYSGLVMTELMVTKPKRRK